MTTKVSIYYLNENANRYLHFASLRFVKNCGLKVERKNYDKIYEFEINRAFDKSLLDHLYTIFNINKPKDFHNRSMSMGDIICINNEEFYYVDDFGFTKLEFF